MRNKIIHALLTLAITLTCLISTPLSLTTRAANADGSITKTAAYCDEGSNGTVVCDGTVSLMNRCGYGSRPTLAVTGAKTTLSHASSNTSVASIDTSGNITLNGLGSTTFTIIASESPDYYSASTTVTLTVVKGNLSTKTVPACSSINYGQALSASTLSGGSVINESSTEVDGTWSWKTPTTVPNAGKFAFTATYKPVDTAHYNY